MSITRRQMIQAGAATAAAVTTSRFTVAEAAAQPVAGGNAKVFSRLGQFVEQYMRERSAPGMTLVLADRGGVQLVAAYGLEDVERGHRVQPDQLFQIGSISKSFIAICLLQLCDEGKLDLHRPVVDYLPWFRVDSAFAAITPHHLLTHSSGLPGVGPVFPADPSQRHRAAHAPGEHFHYNNMAFELLGYLAWTVDGRELPQLLRERVLEPLGMHQTEPVITLDMRERMAKSYAPFQSDRPDRWSARLCEAPGIITTDAAGCIASTARDMGAYVGMLANRGTGPHGRLLSEASFDLFSHAHIAASEFGPTAGYGYGIAVDELDGNAIVRHTGGMVSFMSAILVDIDAGIGAFASINAMQGYRPTAPVEFAVQLLRAARAGKSLPAAPAPTPPTLIANAADYSGEYESPGGRKVVIAREGDLLVLVHGDDRVILEVSDEADRLVAPHGDFARFRLVFARKDDQDPRSAVTELGWGPEWFAGAAYEGPRQFSNPAHWESYAGHYRNEDPWVGSTRVVLRKGRLWLDGVVPLESAGDRFYLRDEEHSPEWIRFGEIVNGRCMRLTFSNQNLWRVAAV